MAFNKIYSVIGARGTGKTPLIMGGEDERGMAKIFLEKKMSVLILDTLDHPKYSMIQTILPKDFGKLSRSTGIYRCLANADDMQIVIRELKKVWNTFIVFEDAYKYTGTRFNQDMRTVIADSKQQNNDLLYMYSCWAWTPIDLVRQANYLIVFKTMDSPECRMTALGGCAKEVENAHIKVMTGKPRYIIVDSGI